jgi:hypothetical protein
MSDPPNETTAKTTKAAPPVGNRRDGLREYGQPIWPVVLIQNATDSKFDVQLWTKLNLPRSNLREHGQSVLNLQFLDLSMAKFLAIAHQT